MTPMQFQFTPHALDRLTNRYGQLVSYCEVQQAMSYVCGHGQLRRGNGEVYVKTLPRTVEVTDESAFGGKTKGSKVFALVHVTADGAFVDTVVLR